MILLTLALLTAADSTVSRDIQVAPGEFVRTTAIGSGPPVVFIPGIFGSAFAYRKVTSPLAGRGYRCIVVEPLGFGWSSHPRRANYSLTAQSDRLARALDSLGVRHALVVAHSLAASIGFRLAIRRPDLVRGLLSIDGGPVETAATPGLRHALRFGGFLTKLFVGTGTLRREVRHQLVENSGDTTWITDRVVLAYTAGQAGDVHGEIDAMRSMSKSVEPESLRARLHECHVPVRLLVGTIAHPSAVKSAEVEFLRAQLTNFAIDTVRGSGQYIQEEQPSAILAALTLLDRGAR